MPNTDQIRTVMELKASQYKVGLQSVVKEMKKMQSQAKALDSAVKKSERGFEQYDEALRRVSIRANQTNNAFARLKKSALTIASFGAVFYAISRVATGFDSVIERGFKYSNLLRNVKVETDLAAKATAGLVSNIELMQASSRASAFGLDLSRQAFSDLAKAATIAAKRMGIDVNQAIGDMITGMARMSPKILDNLGITIRAKDAYKEFAKSVGKATSELTASEKQLAFTSSAIKKLSKIASDGKLVVDDLGGSWKKFKTSVTNSNDALSGFLSSAKTGSRLLSGIADRTKFAADMMRFYGDALLYASRQFLTTPSGMKEIVSGKKFGELARKGRLKHIAGSEGMGDFLRYSANLPDFIRGKMPDKDLKEVERLASIAIEDGTELAMSELRWAVGRAVRKYSVKNIKKNILERPVRQDLYKPKKGRKKTERFDFGAENAASAARRKQLEEKLKIANKVGIVWGWQGMTLSDLRAYEQRVLASSASEVSSDQAKGMSDRRTMFDMLAKEELRLKLDRDSAKLSVANALDPEGVFSDKLMSMTDQLTTATAHWASALKSVESAALGVFGAWNDSIWSAIAGEKRLGEALEENFRKVFKGLGQEASMKASMSLAVGDFRSAAIYGTVAALAGAATAAMGSGQSTARRNKSSSRGKGGTTYSAPSPAPTTMTFNINSLVASSDEEQFARAIANGTRLARQRGY